ncbi:hypothetical protein [Halanaerobium hydrogeniformans]|uniref:Uncharacterized protein n=1 Tax=Halanaerobium hydrogeniformans TaxID=656519 RepID=E4RP67_HALHG|nr:hypothetical protein [Halanaerobium hydrogeniformans]ADQ13892.1 hypothetical protein Halsa_0417 [Halanaerobium hydrogeniformans]
MEYYRKAAAVLIVVLALILPFVLKQAQITAVVDLDQLTAESSYINNLKENVEANPRPNAELEAEIMQLLKETTAELAAKENYQTVVLKHPIYKGGEDITETVIREIDNNNGF